MSDAASMTVERAELLERGSIQWSERWRSDLLKLWHGAQAVVIQHCANPEKKTGFKKIQRIKLQTSPRSPTPTTDVDDVVEAIAESVYGWLDDQVEAEALEASDVVTFAVEVQRVTAKKDSPARQKVWITASLDGSAEDPYDNAEHQALSELERRTQQHIENLQRENDHKTIHIENLHETLIRLATINVAPVKSAAEMMEMANMMAMQGMQASLQAAAMQYNVEGKRIEEEGKSRRIEMWTKSVGKHVMPFIPSAVASLIDKIRGGTGHVEGPSGPIVDDDDEGAQQRAAFDAYWRTELGRLKESITPEQHAALRNILATSQTEKLMEMLDSQTFQEAAQRYSQLLESFIPVDGEEANPVDEITEALKEVFTHRQALKVQEFHITVCEWIEANEKAQEQQQ